METTAKKEYSFQYIHTTEQKNKSYYDKAEDERADLEARAKKVLETLMQRYQPATKEDYDTILETVEIEQLLFRHTGVPLDRSSIFATMEDMQFKQGCLSGNDLYWFMKKVE